MRTLIISALLAGAASADELVLKDGTTVEWIMLRDRGSDYLVETPKRKRITIPKDRVERIVMKGPEAPLTGAAVGGTKQKAADSRTVDLLKTIKPNEDGVSGSWTVTKEALTSSGRSNERLELQFEPPLEYDFTVEFRVTSGRGPVVQVLAAGGKSFCWEMGVSAAFGYVQGKAPADNPTTKPWKNEPDKKYISVVKVRRNGVAAYVNGKLVTSWKTNYKDMGPPHRYYPLRNDRRIGVGSLNSVVEFSRIEVLQVSGKGRLTR